jgi:Ni/Co efflux regulator RcnB
LFALFVFALSHYNDEQQDRAKTNKANKKHHTKHYNDEPQDRAKINKANNKHHTKHYNDEQHGHHYSTGDEPMYYGRVNSSYYL